MSDDTIADLMEATHRALCKHGYAEVTMQDIAAESTKSKGTLHYHFESKQDLLESFLEFLLDRFEERTETVPGETPAEQLHEFTDELLTPSDDAAEEFRTAILEIKAQSPYDDAFRERLRRFDDAFAEAVREVVAEGVADGTFREEVDPEEVASFLTTYVNGAQTRHVGVGHPPERSAAEVYAYIDETLLTDSGGRTG